MGPRRTWCCSECGASLGRVRRVTGRRYLFATVNLQSAARIDIEVWRLSCSAGHETIWRGAGINWWSVAEVA